MGRSDGIGQGSIHTRCAVAPVPHVRRSFITVAVVFASLVACAPALAVGPYNVLVSTSPARSEPAALAGQTVSGSIYVFTKPDTTDIRRVRFWLDDPQHATVPRK